MALRSSVKNLPSSSMFHSMAWPLRWVGLEAWIASPLAASEQETDEGGWLASVFLALLICLAIAAFCWMQRRERVIEQYAEEESRMRNTIAEAQASIDEQVDAEIAAASAASGSSFTATAAALPRPSTGNALNQPLPAKPKVSLPGCGPLPGDDPKAAATRASFAATARRSVVQRRSSDEYMIGDTSFMTVASAAAREATQASKASTRKSTASTATSEARRKSVADLAEARKSLVEVMQMYGPDEEPADAKVNRTSLSGWYSDDKDKPENEEAAAARERSLSSWYASEQERRVSVDPSKAACRQPVRFRACRMCDSSS
ncbi:unnamed protein product [Symbiodinium pilosum]|uniref:Uncharacterized protein n=1 Tax=Symbiodinium pilosum TaxID=2952 RepID=A0A812WF93_SYMPI|nr:unnamed protein product [Symbiodinium pilosum]